MSEIVPRGAAVVGRAVNSGAVAPGVAALFTMAGIGFGDPAVAALGVPAGAAVGAVAEEMVDVVHRLFSSRRANVERFAATVADEAGAPLEDLLRAASPRALEFLAQTVGAASQAVDDWKVDVLAAVWAQSIDDDAAVDDGLLGVDALRQLEVSHLRLLRILETVRYAVGWGPASQANPERKVLPRLFIVRQDPGLDRAFDVLAGKLVSLGMANWESLRLSQPSRVRGMGTEGLTVTGVWFPMRRLPGSPERERRRWYAVSVGRR
ncbi:hypothetical protein RB614_24260 [Phytohabitans sp. ZYX-F-186]|uniref:DUF4393 domain-containing protein n=1 Tax=Phytohabitans maris TaxID=3071409 RepID=A0ABU0ZMZ5_9ACTN|nr:hypothetical protein [Phytohabitans sp. ZYX-F-186]MDQ7907640.1 hypothetical protein [Phytohabitans sp. ZYX-F-186]